MKLNLRKSITLLSLAGVLASSADLLVYEPFNYAPVNDEVNGRLAGKSGGIGWGAAWVDSADSGFAFIYDSQGNPVDLYGGTFGLGDPNWDGVINNLPRLGSYVGLSDWSSEPLGQSRLNAYRRLAQSAGTMAADNGGVLWLSMGVHFANNGFFVTPTMMLTTEDSYLQERGRTLSGSGAGLGTALGNDFNNGTLTKDLNPLFMAAGVQTVKTTGVDILAASRPDLTVVVKFEFGDPNDTVRVWYFGEDATMDEATFNANAISATSSIDESTLNTFTYAIDRKANAIDEIRIGETFTDIITLPPPGAVDIDVSTASASPTAAPADGTTTSTITVTLRDAIGVPVANKDVTLANTSGPGTPVITPLTAVTTNANGQATFTVSSNTPGTAVFTATDVTDTLVITQTASVTFVDSADGGQSTVVASPLYVDANGTSTATVTVSLKSAELVPVAGKNVTLAGSPGTAVITPPGGQISDVNGVVTFTVSSVTSGAVVFTATDTTDAVVITQTASVNFVGPGDAALSTVVASPNSVVANGTTTSTITVTLKDANGFPAAGRNVTLANTAGPQAAVINPLTPVATNANGVATFTVSSSTLGTEVFTATDTTDSVVITQTASVEFVDSATPFAFNVSFVQFTPSLGDFEDPAALEGPGGGSGETWNQIRAVSGSNLLASDGTATGVSVTTNFSECRQRSTTGLTLLNDALTDFDKGLSRSVTISGLPPGSLHNVWLASTATGGDASERSNGTFSTSNATSTVGGQLIDQSVAANTTTWEQGNNYVLFENVVVDGSGQINLTAAATTGFRLTLSGFQIVPVGPAVITSFEAGGVEGVIDQNAKTISLTVPSSTNLATLAPTFTLSSGTSNQTSGAPPSPTFAAQNPVTYTVTDVSTDPDTVNNYIVTVTVDAATTTLVIDLGTSPAGTTIQGSTFIGSGPINLPLPALPLGSILRSIAINTKLEVTDNDNFASDLSVLLDPTPGSPGGDFSVGISNGVEKFGAVLQLGWPASANAGPGTSLVDTKTDTDWAGAGAIDLATTGLFLGNAYGTSPPAGGTWSGTITLTYDLVGAGSDYATWSGGAAADIDSNGDGVYNGVAWALDAPDPNANAIGLLPILDNTSDPTYVIFKFNRGDLANDDTNTSILVEYGNNLVGWTTAVDDNDNVDIIVNPGSPTDEVIVKLKRSTLGTGGKIFARLKVVVTP
jgi:hypothetical protein